MDIQKMWSIACWLVQSNKASLCPPRMYCRQGQAGRGEPMTEVEALKAIAAAIDDLAFTLSLVGLSLVCALVGLYFKK